MRLCFCIQQNSLSPEQHLEVKGLNTASRALQPTKPTIRHKSGSTLDLFLQHHRGANANQLKVTANDVYIQMYMHVHTNKNTRSPQRLAQHAAALQQLHTSSSSRTWTATARWQLLHRYSCHNTLHEQNCTAPLQLQQASPVPKLTSIQWHKMSRTR